MVHFFSVLKFPIICQLENIYFINLVLIEIVQSRKPDTFRGPYLTLEFTSCFGFESKGKLCIDKVKLTWEEV